MKFRTLHLTIAASLAFLAVMTIHAERERGREDPALSDKEMRAVFFSAMERGVDVGKLFAGPSGNPKEGALRGAPAARHLIRSGEPS